MNGKPALRSLTVVSIIALVTTQLICYILRKHGFSEFNQDEIGATVGNAVSGVAALVALIGRVRATGPITSISSQTDPPQQGYTGLSIIGFVLIFGAVTLNACGPEDKKAKEAFDTFTTANHKIAVVTKGAIRSTEVLLDNQIISKENVNEIIPFYQDVLSANAELTVTLQSIRADSPELRIEVDRLVNKLTAAVDRLKANGTLHIRNPEARAKVDLLLAGINTTVSTAVTAFRSLPKPKPKPSPTPAISMWTTNPHPLLV